jgi:hypothetical protein
LIAGRLGIVKDETEIGFAYYMTWEIAADQTDSWVADRSGMGETPHPEVIPIVKRIGF